MPRIAAADGHVPLCPALGRLGKRHCQVWVERRVGTWDNMEGGVLPHDGLPDLGWEYLAAARYFFTARETGRRGLAEDGTSQWPCRHREMDRPKESKNGQGLAGSMRWTWSLRSAIPSVEGNSTWLPLLTCVLLTGHDDAVSGDMCFQCSQANLAGAKRSRRDSSTA